MQPTSSVYLRGKLLKVRFHCPGRSKSKAFQLTQLTYPQLLANLVSCFKLEMNSFYELSYQDQEGDMVTVSNETDFDNFLEHAKTPVLELIATSGQHKDFRRNVDLPKAEGSDKKEEEDLAGQLEVTRERVKQLEKEVGELKEENASYQERFRAQEREIARLNERNKEDVLQQKKRQLLTEFEKYKVELRDKYVQMLEQKLQEQLKKLQKEPEKGDKPVEPKQDKPTANEEKASMLVEILSIAPKAALSLVRDNPGSDLQTLVAIYYCQ